MEVMYQKGKKKKNKTKKKWTNGPRCNKYDCSKIYIKRIMMRSISDIVPLASEYCGVHF